MCIDSEIAEMWLFRFQHMHRADGISTSVCMLGQRNIAGAYSQRWSYFILKQCSNGPQQLHHRRTPAYALQMFNPTISQATPPRPIDSPIKKVIFSLFWTKWSKFTVYTLSLVSCFHSSHTDLDCKLKSAAQTPAAMHNNLHNNVPEILGRSNVNSSQMYYKTVSTHFASCIIILIFKIVSQSLERNRAHAHTLFLISIDDDNNDDGERNVKHPV